MNPKKFKEVQAELPCLGSAASLKKLPECNQGRPLKSPRTEDNVKEILIDIAISLCSHEKNADIWKQQYKKHKPHPIRFLLRLLAFGDSGDATPPFDSRWTSSVSCHVADLPGLGHEHFENLYYLVICKLTELHDHLQNRFACKFVSLNYVLHNHGVDGSGCSPFTVQDMRDFTIRSWHLLHDDAFKYHFNKAIKERKHRSLGSYGVWEVVTLLRSHNICSSSLVEKFDNVQGLSTELNPVALLDIVYRKYNLGPYGAWKSTKAVPEPLETLRAVSLLDFPVVMPMSAAPKNDAPLLPQDSLPTSTLDVPLQAQAGSLELPGSPCKCCAQGHRLDSLDRGLLPSNADAQIPAQAPLLAFEVPRNTESAVSIGIRPSNTKVRITTPPHVAGATAAITSGAVPDPVSPVHLYMGGHGHNETHCMQIDPIPTPLGMLHGSHGGNTVTLVQETRPRNVLVVQNTTGVHSMAAVTHSADVGPYPLPSPTKPFDCGIPGASTPDIKVPNGSGHGVEVRPHGRRFSAVLAHRIHSPPKLKTLLGHIGHHIGGPRGSWKLKERIQGMFSHPQG